MKKHYNLTQTEDNGKSVTTTNTSTEHPEELLRILALAGQKVEVTPVVIQPVEDNCGCGQTPCVSSHEAVEEEAETEYTPTPANDKLDLDDFSKKTANSISRQKKSLKPSAGDNPLEYSLDEEAIYDALMTEFNDVDESFSHQVTDFGMFSKGGNAQVQNIIQYTLDDFADEIEDATNSERDSLRMDALKTMFQELEELAMDEKYAEADDTEVRERASAYMDQGIIRIMNRLDKS